jgi:hypothetical protein
LAKSSANRPAISFGGAALALKLAPFPPSANF